MYIVSEHGQSLLLLMKSFCNYGTADMSVMAWSRVHYILIDEIPKPDNLLPYSSFYIHRFHTIECHAYMYILSSRKKSQHCNWVYAFILKKVPSATNLRFNGWPDTIINWCSLMSPNWKIFKIKLNMRSLHELIFWYSCTQCTGNKQRPYMPTFQIWWLPTFWQVFLSVPNIIFNYA